MSGTPGRQRSLIFPREHGAWGILLVPLVTGASVGLQDGNSGWSLAPLAIAVLAMFWLRTPLESWMGTVPTKARSRSEFELVKRAALILAAIAVAALIWLLWGWRNLDLLWIGAIAAAAFLVQATVRRIWRKARTAAQMIGAAGLTVVAPAAYYVVSGQLNARAWLLWLLNLAFAANQIQFVQLRIRGAHAMTRTGKSTLGGPFIAAQATLITVLVAGCAVRVLSWYAAIAFVPVVGRGFAWFASTYRPLAIHALGKRELMHAIVFGVLLIVAFHLS